MTAVRLIAVLVVAGVTVLPQDAPTPRCERAPRALIEVTAGTEEDVLARMTRRVADAGGDTLKLTKTQSSPQAKLVRFQGYGFRCKGGDEVQ